MMSSAYISESSDMEQNTSSSFEFGDEANNPELQEQEFSSLSTTPKVITKRKRQNSQKSPRLSRNQTTETQPITNNITTPSNGVFPNISPFSQVHTQPTTVVHTIQNSPFPQHQTLTTSSHWPTSTTNYHPGIQQQQQQQQQPQQQRPQLLHPVITNLSENTTSFSEAEHSTSTDHTIRSISSPAVIKNEGNKTDFDFIKKQRRILLLIVIISSVILAASSDLFASPDYCFPREINSLDISAMINTNESQGTITIRSYSFSIIEDDLLLTIAIRNFGKPVSNPRLRILFNNPHSNDNSTAIIEDTYYLHDCKCSPLQTAPKKLYIRIPFPIESSLHLAMNIQTHIKIIIESDNKIVLNENIHLTPNIIFSNTFLTQNDRIPPVRVIVFGEQGSGKTTLINDFLNNLRGISSKINFTPPPFGGNFGAGMTVGVAKVSITNQISDLESSLIFYDTEGSRTGEFKNFLDLYDIISNPPKEMYLKHSSASPVNYTDDSFCYFYDNDHFPTLNSSLFHIPENPDERINFVLYTFNSRQFIRTDDKEVFLDNVIRESYATVALAISRYNEENPSTPIQPIILITFGNELTRDANSWWTDDQTQSAYIEIVKKNLNEDPVPILIHQTSFPNIKDSEKVYVLQSVSKLVYIMQQYVPNIIQQNDLTFLDKLLRVLQSFFSFEIWERVKYFHTHVTWLIGCFFMI